MGTYDSVKANEAQIKYCEEHDYPHFAPTRFCYSCGRDIYAQQRHSNRAFSTGISVESASNHLITGCPHCNRSFCD